MINKLEKHGGICDSQASRDTFIYAASAYTTGGLPDWITKKKWIILVYDLQV